MSTQVVNVLQNESRQIDERLLKLHKEEKELLREKDFIQTFVQQRKARFGLHQGGAKPKAEAPVKQAAARKPVARTVKTAVKAHRQGLTTMEMVRQVLNNHRAQNQRDPEMSPQDLRQAIVETYGNVGIAESMPQMLYKRSRAGNTFYRIAGNRYGLKNWDASSEQNAA